MRRGGYTLIELLVTIALLAFLTAFIIPTYQLLLSQFELTNAANQVANFLRLTEQKTLTEQQIYGVTLTVGSSSIAQFQYNPGNGTKTYYPPSGTITSSNNLNLPSFISIDSVNFSGNSDIRFSTAGAPNVSGNLVLIDSTRSRRRSIVIGPSGVVSANSGEY